MRGSVLGAAQSPETQVPRRQPNGGPGDDVISNSGDVVTALLGLSAANGTPWPVLKRAALRQRLTDNP